MGLGWGFSRSEKVGKYRTRVGEKGAVGETGGNKVAGTTVAEIIMPYYSGGVTERTSRMPGSSFFSTQLIHPKACLPGEVKPGRGKG